MSGPASGLAWRVRSEKTSGPALPGHRIIEATLESRVGVFVSLVPQSGLAVGAREALA